MMMRRRRVGPPGEKLQKEPSVKPCRVLLVGLRQALRRNALVGLRLSFRVVKLMAAQPPQQTKHAMHVSVHGVVVT
jgi:hypothetical protein